MIKVLIMNGPAESGKDTVAEFIKEVLLDWKIKQYSSIDYVKEVAKKNFNWDSIKDTAGRNLLSAMKQIMIEYNDLPTKKIIAKIEESIIFEIDLLVVDIREKDEIQKLVDYCKNNNIQCNTCRVHNTSSEMNVENSDLSVSGDKMYGKFDYCLHIYNNGSLYELKNKVQRVFNDLYIHKNLKKPIISAPGSRRFEPAMELKYNHCEICFHGRIEKDKRTKNSICSYCGQVYRKD